MAAGADKRLLSIALLLWTATTAAERQLAVGLYRQWIDMHGLELSPNSEDARADALVALFEAVDAAVDGRRVLTAADINAAIAEIFPPQRAASTQLPVPEDY